jgi:hypothetical protein
MRLGAIRNTMWAELDPALGNLDPLRRLAALDRYEARALTRRRRIYWVCTAKLRRGELVWSK